ncbi:MAG: maltose acetyltransferase domain-containing protein [Enterocloster sp.]
MDMLEIMKKEEAYCSDHRDMPGELQKKAKMLCWRYNQTSPEEGDVRAEILQELLGTCHPLTFIEPSFRCDYGFNIHTHGLTVINYNCVILDTSRCISGKTRLLRRASALPAPAIQRRGPAGGRDRYVSAGHHGGTSGSGQFHCLQRRFHRGRDHQGWKRGHGISHPG